MPEPPTAPGQPGRVLCAAPSGARLIQLWPVDKGFAAVVDEEDYLRVVAFEWRWRKSGVVRCDDSRITLAAFVFGKAPPSAPVIDHRDGDTLNNRKGNLRFASHAQNSANRGNRPGSNSSGYYGIRTEVGGRGRVKYQGIVRLAGSKYLTKWYTYPKAAARARDDLAFKIQGEFGVYNFPRQELGALTRLARNSATWNGCP